MSELLQLSNVSVRFGGLSALSEVSFQVSRGEVVAVIGPNGAGKTSLFNVITGYVPPNSGEVRFCGDRIDGLTPHAISARGVRRTFQNGGLFADLTVLENVLSGLHTQIGDSLFGILFGLPDSRAAERKAVARARELLGVMDIQHLAGDLVSRLSGGQQRMVEIVRALATDPPLLLLDEPAVGLAPPVRAQLILTIRRLAEEHNLGILVIEHAIEMVMTMSDRIIVLNNGQKIAEGTPEEVRKNAEVMEAYLGHA